jgi:hypothetical protein
MQNWHAWIFSFLLALILPGWFALPSLAAPGAQSKDACEIWLEDRLLVDRDLESRRFIVDGSGKFEVMPSFRSAANRQILHSTHFMYLDVLENVSLYQQTKRTCVIGRDSHKKGALALPIFFVGRAGQSRETLKEHAAKVAFAPSESLDESANFADVSFRLRHGASIFTDIRPFFRCGLPGLLLCEGTCPRDNVELAASLVNSVVKGEGQAADASPPEASGSAPAPEKGKAGNEDKQAAQNAPNKQEAPTPALPPVQAPAQASKNEPSASAPAAASNRYSSEPAPQPATPAPTSPPVAVPPPVAAPPQPAQTQPSAAERKRLVLTFEKQDGSAIEAGEVLQAEGGVTFEGAQFASERDGLAAELPSDAFRRASDSATLTKVFHQHRVLAVKQQAENVLLTVEPLYIRADDVLIKIQNAAGEPVRTCDLRLDVAQDRRLGSGWAKMGREEKSGGLKYTITDADYRLDLPAGTDEHELLIDTARIGATARLSNTAMSCGLEARPIVTAEELRSLTVMRSLRETGPILFALATTGSNFSTALPSATGSFWASALDLVNAVSSLSWERKILARAQAPGVDADTKILRGADGTAPLLEPQEERARIATLLSDGSKLNGGALSILQFEPIERFHLDLVLKTIRDKAKISAAQSTGQEALLLISGSVKSSGSDFCRRAMRGEANSAERPQWLKQTRRAFILEVWGETAIEAMKKEGRSEIADDAPAGVFRCKIGGGDGDKIKLYALSAATVADQSARTTAFAYLSTLASAFLKP